MPGMVGLTTRFAGPVTSAETMFPRNHFLSAPLFVISHDQLFAHAQSPQPS